MRGQVKTSLQNKYRQSVIHTQCRNYYIPTFCTEEIVYVRVYTSFPSYTYLLTRPATVMIKTNCWYEINTY